MLQSAMQAAAERAGLDDYGTDNFLGPAAAWCRDLDTAKLTSFARALLAKTLGQDLVRRLRIVDFLERHPEVLEVELPPTIVIVGPPRSGTTLLHNLMGRQKLARPMQRWELTIPLPPPETSSYETDPRIARVAAGLEKQRALPLTNMHWIAADDPEECVRGFYDCSGMFMRSCMRAMPTWGEFLVGPDHDRETLYREYRTVLQLLTWKCPAPPGGHLLLKAPQHSQFLPDLAKVFPEARFVITHRDPFRVIVSTARMVDLINTPLVGDPELMRNDGTAARYSQSLVIPCLRTLAEYARESPGRTVNVDYSELMRDPVETTAAIYRNLDLETPNDLATRINKYLADQRKGTRPEPPTDLPTYGYNRADISADPVVREYCDQFNVATEPTRLSDPARG